MQNIKKKRVSARLVRENLTWYSFIIVTLLTVILLVYVPTGTTLLFSFSEVSLKGLKTTFIGLKNYEVIFSMGAFWKSILNTLVLAGMGLLVIPLGFLQVALLRRLRDQNRQPPMSEASAATGDDGRTYSRSELLRGALLTINGIAAGMRNTG